MQMQHMCTLWALQRNYRPLGPNRGTEESLFSHSCPTMAHGRARSSSSSGQRPGGAVTCHLRFRVRVRVRVRVRCFRACCCLLFRVCSDSKFNTSCQINKHYQEFNTGCQINKQYNQTKQKRESAMRIDIDKMLTSSTCMQNLNTKKIITIKPSIQTKFRLHHYLSYDKIFKTKPHLPIFSRYF